MGIDEGERVVRKREETVTLEMVVKIVAKDGSAMGDGSAGQWGE